MRRSIYIAGVPIIWCIALLVIGQFGKPLGDVSFIQLATFGARANADASTFETVTVLDISDVDHPDEMMAIVPKCINIESLIIAPAQVSDNGISHCSSLHKLRELKLGNSPITDTGFLAFQNCSCLEHLTLSSPGMTDNGVAVLANMPRLTSLELRNTSITDRGMAVLGSLHCLRLLVLDGNPGITDLGLSHLKSLPNLQFLSLAGTSITDPDWERFISRHLFCSIDLSDTSISEKSIPILLQSCVRLVSLRLKNTHIRRIIADGSTAIKSLQLDGSPIDDKGIAGIGKMKQLRSLSLCRTKVTNAGMATIQQLLRLRTLSIADTAVDEQGMICLGKCSNLLEITMSRQHITWPAIDAIRRSLPGVRIFVQ